MLKYGRRVAGQEILAVPEADHHATRITDAELTQLQQLIKEAKKEGR